VDNEAAFLIGLQSRGKFVQTYSQSVFFLSQVPLAKPQLTQHRVEQTGSDFSASVFEHGKAIAKTERPVAALSALLVKADDHSSLAAEPSQSAQQLVSGHI